MACRCFCCGNFPGKLHRENEPGRSSWRRPSPRTSLFNSIVGGNSFQNWSTSNRKDGREKEGQSLDIHKGLRLSSQDFQSYYFLVVHSINAPSFNLIQGKEEGEIVVERHEEGKKQCNVTTTINLVTSS